jgi:hypothetical protein
MITVSSRRHLKTVLKEIPLTGLLTSLPEAEI